MSGGRLAMTEQVESLTVQAGRDKVPGIVDSGAKPRRTSREQHHPMRAMLPSGCHLQERKNLRLHDLQA